MTKEVKAVAKKEKKTYAPKKKAGLTLGEFKAWLSGVEEMQPRGWVPDASQWKTIRSKFEDIVEGPAPVRTAAPVDYNPANPFEREARISRPLSGFTPPPTMLPPQQPIELPNPNRPVETPNLMPDVSTPEGKKMVGRVKTPNIDTSHGNYTAAFE